MTVTETEHKETPLEPHHSVHEKVHPSDGTYVVLAAILALITAVEVWTYFWDEPSTTLLMGSLIPMMIAKFVIVVGWFMHLRYDNPLYRRVFVAGTVLAVLVYAAVLTALRFYDESWTEPFRGIAGV
jgi:cytochrome c oxidase subunit 4